MSSDSSKQRYVSTFRMHIKPPGTSLPSRGFNDRTSVRCTSEEHSILSSYEAVEPPVFVEPLEDWCVDEGSDIVLRGVLAGSLPMKVVWLHNGDVAYFGSAAFNGREVSFIAQECLPEDAGAYTCVAENSAGKTSCSAAVYVRDFESICGVQNGVSKPVSRMMGNGKPPQTPEESVCTSPTVSNEESPVSSPKEVIPKKRPNSATGPFVQFVNPPQHHEVKLGQTARLTCCFTGSPPVVSCWIRNKVQVVDDAEVWTENTDGSSTLVIAEAKPHHTGSYTIVVKDRKSSAQHIITLSVIEEPEPPASCPVISLISASSLVLSWSGPCYDGGSAILGYVVEAKNASSPDLEDWQELTDHCKSTSYRVCSELQPQQEYCFRVRAFNAAGMSDPSPVSPVVKMEQKDSKKNPPQRHDSTPQSFACVTIDSSSKVTDHYDLQEKLGTGKFGLVFKLKHKETGQVCAGKFYKGRRAKEREAARKEIELMNHLHHSKLVQCIAAYDHNPEMVMVMEFIAGGELFERIVDDNFEHTEPTCVLYMQQIVEGLSYMHQQNIVHLDLKPENIVCVDTAGTAVKLIDFGLASKLEGNTPLKVMHGTPEFVAPEVINFEPVCLATDMWSIGVICYILLSGESPFQGNSDAETLASVTAAEWEFDEESFEDITEEAKHFISSLLNKDTRRRLSCNEALAHPWMAAFNSGDHSATKSLSKEKMKKFLARQKWKKAGKALLALKRMALLSKTDSCASLTSPKQDSPLSPEAEHALQSLDLKMQEPPVFVEGLEYQTVAPGSSVRMSCRLTGYPDPEVVWLCDNEPIEESPTMQIEYEDDGSCTLILARVGPEDTNYYSCQATNVHGQATCTIKLTVQ
ncbi:unnamed protein product [Ophioblennius macclurei]